MARPRSSLAYVIPPRSAPAARGRIAPRHQRAFGRARTSELAVVQPQPTPRASGDLRQLVNTFVGGLVFVGVLIA